jgi:hypothetical protein
MTCHEHLELWIPIDNEAQFRIGDRQANLNPGEIMIVDNLTAHTVVSYPGLHARIISIGFLPEFTYSLGSPSYDYYTLLPFFSHQARPPHVVRRDALLYPAMMSAVVDLLECYFARDLYFQIGCKANLLRLLYALAKHFWVSESLRTVMIRQQATAEIEAGFRIHLEKLCGSDRRREGGPASAFEPVEIQQSLQRVLRDDLCRLLTTSGSLGLFGY